MPAHTWSQPLLDSQNSQKSDTIILLKWSNCGWLLNIFLFKNMLLPHYCFYNFLKVKNKKTLFLKSSTKRSTESLLKINKENKMTSHRLGENICKSRIWQKICIKNKELLKWNNKKINKPIFKMCKRFTQTV